MEQFTTEKPSENITMYTFKKKCKRGGKLMVMATKCLPNNAHENSLPNLWKRNGYIDCVLPNYWYIDVYAYDRKETSCVGAYNPMILPNTSKLNFEWVLEATETNLSRLLDKVCRMAF